MTLGETVSLTILPIHDVSKGKLTRRYISIAGFPIRSDSFQDPCQPWWWAIWCAGQRLESPGWKKRDTWFTGRWWKRKPFERYMWYYMWADFRDPEPRLFGICFTKNLWQGDWDRLYASISIYPSYNGGEAYFQGGAVRFRECAYKVGPLPVRNGVATTINGRKNWFHWGDFTSINGVISTYS